MISYTAHQFSKIYCKTQTKNGNIWLSTMLMPDDCLFLFKLWFSYCFLWQIKSFFCFNCTLDIYYVRTSWVLLAHVILGDNHPFEIQLASLRLMRGPWLQQQFNFHNLFLVTLVSLAYRVLLGVPLVLADATRGCILPFLGWIAFYVQAIHFIWNSKKK